MPCGILNLPECISEKISELLLSIVNAPLLPFLDIIKRLLTQPANIQVFSGLWGVIIYIISVFYGLFIIFAGLNFIISGYNFEKRERAKEWLQNVVLMIFCVQASYLIYSLIVELASGMTSGIVNMIDPNFFLLTLDNAVNVGLEIVLGLFYLTILFISILVFAIIYLIGSIGVVFFPFGIFFYFIPPLQDIGRFIINTLIFILFLPFFASIVLLGAAELLKQGNLGGIKIVIMVSAFAMINALMLIIVIIGIFRSVTTVLRTNTARGLLALKGHFLMSSALDKKPELNEREIWMRRREELQRRYSDYSQYQRR